MNPQEFLTSDLGGAVIVVGILLVTVIIHRIIHEWLDSSLIKTSTLLKIDHTQFLLLKHSAAPIIYLIGIGFAIYFIPPLRSISYSLLASAGLLAVVFGFAAQKTLGNMISGISIAISKPFRVGDIIRVGDREGVVEDITLRHTIIVAYDNKRCIIPNSSISEQLIDNFTIEDKKVCYFFEVMVSHDSNIDKAITIIQKVAEKHPSCLDTRQKDATDPIVRVRAVKLNHEGVTLKAWVWAKDHLTGFRMGCDLNLEVGKQFKKASIKFAYPRRVMVKK